MRDEEKLAVLYKQAEGFNESLPAELLQKLKVMGDILRITGKLHAAALGEWKHAEALRKECIAACFTYDVEGTAKEREMKAEYAAAEHRKKEALAEASCMRWRNAYNSTSEIINILKIQFRDLTDLENGKKQV